MSARVAGRRAAWLAAWLWAAPAWAWEVVAVPVDGPLRPGVPSAVWVAVVEDDGRPVSAAPLVTSDAGVVWPIEVPTPRDVFPFAVVPAVRASEVALTIEVGGRRRTVRLPVRPAPATGLRMADGVIGDARDDRLVVLVQGEDLPPPEQLTVGVSEGSVVSVERALLGLLVTIDLADVPYPRVVAVGVRDARGDAPPVWSATRLRARLSVPIETEPGATATLRIGDRTWGPEEADASGIARLTVEQDPEDRRAELIVRDVGGNETVRSLPLSTVDRPLLVSLSGGARIPGEEPPPLWVYAADARGQPWSGEAPACRTPASDVLPPVRVGPGRWVVAPPPVARGEVWDARVRCSLANLVEVDTTLPLAPGMPVRLDLRVWPEELSTDFPVADLQVDLLDAAGQRVDVPGSLEVSAINGLVKLRPGGGPTWRGEYQGAVAAELGQDAIMARWTPAPGAGPVDRVRVLVGSVGRTGPARLFVRALDRQRRPLQDEVMTVRTSAGAVVVRTDRLGWAEAEVPTPADASPVRFEVETEAERVFYGVVHRGAQGPGPGAADLLTRLELKVDPGRLASVELTVTPAVVRPGGSAELRALFLDRADRPASAEGAEVVASEGRLTPLPSGEDGALAWRWTPPPGFRAREVELVARDPLLDVEDSVTVTVRAAPTSGYFGFLGGLQTNFTGLTAPTVGFDAGVWLRGRRASDEASLPPSRLFLLGHVGWYQGEGEVDSGVGSAGQVRMQLFPIGLALALRQEYPTAAFWVGIGGQLAGWSGSLAFDGEPYLRRGGVLAPGLLAVAGGGVRVAGGELFVELRGTTLSSQGGDAMLSGPVGGLAAQAGYRVLFGAGGARGR
jgi:hypothetical protein